MKQVRRPRALNVEANPPSEHEAQQLYEPGTVHIPSLAWELERDKSLEIDIEVRFDMHLEGDCRLEFRNHNALGEMPQYPRHFMFDVPQWFIESCDTSPEEDDIREDTEPPPGRYFERNPL